jgi:UDP-2-acetamido-3-amino-2,3-dideoxy-glucuronate N-acetyltransferase
VVIAVPAELHHALVMDALLAGKHVFVEKPLALTAQDGTELCDLAVKQDRTLMVGHLLQYHPAFLKLKSLCDNGVLGRVNYIASNRLSFGKFRINENALWSFAPHDISMILALFGKKPETVSAVGHCYLNQSIADVTTTHLTFESGQAAHIHVSWLNPVKEQRLFVIGDKGMAFFDDGEDWPTKLSIFDHQVDWHEGVPIPSKADGKPVPLDPAEPLRLECQHFLDCVADGVTPRTDGTEALGVLRVLDAAQRSMNDQRTINMAAEMTSDKATQIHPTAIVDLPSDIGDSTKIWHFSHILKNSTIGEACNIGQNVVIGPNVTIGNGCKIQNNVSVYDGVTLEDNVFCGPSMVFTNVVNPRAEVSRKDEFGETLVRTGVTIGANATIVCGVEIGRYAFIGAGAVVTKDVPEHALMIGNPAQRVGHMCICGERLPDGEWQESACSSCRRAYVMSNDTVSLAD